MEEVIEAAASQVIDKGSTIIETHDGKRIFIITSALLQMDVNGVLISYEGRGCVFWDARQPLSKWTFIGMGFPGFIASIVISVIQRIVQHRLQKSLENTRSRKRP